MALNIVNARKQKDYWQFDLKVNRDVTLLRLRFYPESQNLRGNFIEVKGRLRKGQKRWLPVIQSSQFFKDTLHRLCAEKWRV